MRPVAVMVAAGVLVLAACGPNSRVHARAAPKLSRSVATSLATRSDALAAALRRGDGCAARIQMHGLERQTRLAIAAGRVPERYRPRLLAAERTLATRVPACIPPAPPPPPPEPPAKEHGKHEKKHDDHGKKKHDDHGKNKHGGGEGD